MKKTVCFMLAALLACVLFSGCSQAGAAASQESGIATEGATEKLNVVTTIFPPYDFVREIAGENAEVRMLLPPGSESHSYEPTPQDIIKIQDCDLFIYVGGESDAWANRILESMDTSEMRILAMTDVVDVVEEELVEGMQEEEHEHAEDGHEGEEAGAESHEHELDEHVWTSPKNAKLIVQAISDALQEIDAGGAQEYEQNTSAYLSELDELDAAFEDAVSNASRKAVVFGDRFPFRYFVDAYGLTYYAAFPGCSGETEASAQTVAFLIDKVSEEHIPVVFHIEFSNEQIADAICEATGAQKLLLHSCHNVSPDDIENGISYIGLMAQNVENLKEALS